MIKSMTGYGRGDYLGPAFNITAELRSVNHRYADFFLRVPREFQSLEDRIRRLLQKKIGRGRVEVNIIVRGSPARSESVAINEHLAAVYYRALQDLSENLELSLNIGVSELLQMPGVIEASDPVLNEKVLWPFIESALHEALKELLEQRAAEGDNLLRDLTARLENLNILAKELTALMPMALQEQKIRLQSRLEEAISGSFDEGRLITECAVLVERMDVHEEVVRLKSHLEAFDKALQQNKGPVGRRLDFIAQEIFREINTVGAKSQDYRLAALVVEVKTELEKMREQIQNIE